MILQTVKILPTIQFLPSLLLPLFHFPSSTSHSFPSLCCHVFPYVLPAISLHFPTLSLLPCSFMLLLVCSFHLLSFLYLPFSLPLLFPNFLLFNCPSLLLPLSPIFLKLPLYYNRNGFWGCIWFWQCCPPKNSRYRTLFLVNKHLQHRI